MLTVPSYFQGKPAPYNKAANTAYYPMLLKELFNPVLPMFAFATPSTTGGGDLTVYNSFYNYCSSTTGTSPDRG